MKRFVVFLIVIILGAPSFSMAQDKTVSEEEKVSTEEASKESFTHKINATVINFTDKIEVWRKQKSVDFKASMEKIEDRRSDNKDAKPAIKVLTMLHIYGLAALVFLFSLQFVFYTATILIAIGLLRRLFGTIFGLFRRE